ncbi:MAG TPA: redoxin domain-containing protein, partial [Cellvibrio sp.]
MKLLLVGALFVGLCASSAFAQLKTGDTALQFNTQASLGGKAYDYSLQESLKKGPVVVYFYPTAFGGGCSIQARAFAVNHEKFTKAG